VAGAKWVPERAVVASDRAALLVADVTQDRRPPVDAWRRRCANARIVNGGVQDEIHHLAAVFCEIDQQGDPVTTVARPLASGGISLTLKTPHATIALHNDALAGSLAVSHESSLSLLTRAQSAASAGGTALRYDATAGYFIQNWKVPATPGTCYLVRTVTTADGLALTARFKVK
jgi:hypothetical protein